MHRGCRGFAEATFLPKGLPFPEWLILCPALGPSTPRPTHLSLHECLDPPSSLWPSRLGGGSDPRGIPYPVGKDTLGPFPKPERPVTTSISQPDSWGSSSLLWVAETSPHSGHQGKGWRDSRLASQGKAEPGWPKVAGGGDLLWALERGSMGREWAPWGGREGGGAFCLLEPAGVGPEAFKWRQPRPQQMAWAPQAQFSGWPAWFPPEGRNYISLLHISTSGPSTDWAFRKW